MLTRRRRGFLFDIVGADSGSEDQQESEDENEDGSDDSSENENEDESLEEQVERLEAELDEARKGRRAGDRARKKLTRELEAANREVARLKEGKPDNEALDAANARIAELEAELEGVEAEKATTAVREAFRDNTDYDWHNPATAFNLLDLDEIDVDDNGKVDRESMKDAIKALATAHPYLVRKKDAEQDEDENEPEARPKSGSGARNQKTNRTQRRQAVAAKFGIAGRV